MSSPKKVMITLAAAGLALGALQWFSHPTIAAREPADSTGAGSTAADSASADPQPLVWSRDLKASLAQAKKDNKFVLADIYTEWCGYCKLLDRNTFSNPSMVSYLQSQFLVVKLNAEDNKEGTKVANERDVSGYPTALVFNPDGKMVGRIVGYKDAKGYQDALSKLVKHNPASGGGDADDE
jgi:thiol:disulfide interchange protein